MATRIYAVRDAEEGDGAPGKLVRAGNPAQAIRHVVRGRYTAEVATQDQLVAILQSGVKVEDAGEEGAA